MDWKVYEEKTAELFRGLGCDVRIAASIKGARATHKIDVWVGFTRFGIETKWIVECKYWQTSVTKEKVLTLQSVLEDVGADRGILVSNVGFQAGAVRAAQHTNITLTSLDELRETAQQELLSSALHNLETRAIELQHALHGLYVSERTGPNSFVSKPLTGVDGRAVMEAMGKLAELRFGFEYARLSQPPYLVDDSSEPMVAITTLEEFVTRAKNIIDDAGATFLSNKRDSNG